MVTLLVIEWRNATVASLRESWPIVVRSRLECLTLRLGPSHVRGASTILAHSTSQVR